MKKTFFFTFVSLMLAFGSYAQFKKGDKLINAGIGLRALWIPIGASVEYGITDQISVGGMAAFASWSGWGTSTYFGVRGAYHVNDLLKLNNDKVDLYAGGGLGYQKWSYKGISGSYDGGIFPIFFVGGRYYFKESLGVYAELGGGTAALNAGVTLKF